MASRGQVIFRGRAPAEDSAAGREEDLVVSVAGEEVVAEGAVSIY